MQAIKMNKHWVAAICDLDWVKQHFWFAVCDAW
jgi:hypothetical protein